MRGEIVAFDAAQGTGEIAGDDFARYSFRAEDARSPALLRVGARVDFTATEDRRATGIGVLVKNVAAPEIDGKRFDIGRVIQRTFSAIRRNWAVFLAGSAVLVGAPSLLMSSGQADLMLIGNGTISPAAAFGTFALGMLLYLVGYYLLQGMMLKAAINGFSGKSTPLGTALNVGLRNALPLFALGILAGLGMGLGFILLIVPGVILAVMWIVVAPVLVAERRSAAAVDDWFVFVRENPDLLQQGGRLLRRYYSQDLLDSGLAKQQFLLPDFPRH